MLRIKHHVIIVEYKATGDLVPTLTLALSPVIHFRKRLPRWFICAPQTRPAGLLGRAFALTTHPAPPPPGVFQLSNPHGELSAPSGFCLSEGFSQPPSLK